MVRFRDVRRCQRGARHPPLGPLSKSRQRDLIAPPVTSQQGAGQPPADAAAVNRDPETDSQGKGPAHSPVRAGTVGVRQGPAKAAGAPGLKAAAQAEGFPIRANYGLDGQPG
jgi:hypothetical protein